MKRLPFEVSVAKACQQQWNDMSGTSAQRHCDSCNKTVHNFAAMTPRQIERLVVATGGNICARIRRDEDGTLVTLQPERSRFAALVAFSAVFAVATPTLAQTNQSTDQDFTQRNAPETTSAGQILLAGTVTDSEGALVVGSTVTLVNHEETVASTTTDGRGEFQLSAPPGDYQLHVAALSFAPFVTPLQLQEGVPEAQNITLHPGVNSSISVTVSPTDYTTIGTFAMTLTTRRHRLTYRLRHPVAYAKYLAHQH